MVLLKLTPVGRRRVSRLTSRQEACFVTLRVKKPVVLCEMHSFTYYHLMYKGTITICWSRKQQLLKH